MHRDNYTEIFVCACTVIHAKIQIPALDLFIPISSIFFELGTHMDQEGDKNLICVHAHYMYTCVCKGLNARWVHTSGLTLSGH